MKLFFISSAFYILYLMKLRYKHTWDPSVDTLRVEFLVVPAVVLGFAFPHKHTLLEVGGWSGAAGSGAGDGWIPGHGRA